ncbi:MAG: EamA family transporter [Chloroflexi bacterium]|nr:EamA family transporter [Chloroflexota bacterium]
MTRAEPWKIAAALASIYFIWGSTYLAIRFAIETIPPFLMAGTRFILAGVLLYPWARWRGSAPPQPAHWKSALIISGLLLLGGNGGVSWAEQRVPSGLTALMISTVPLWMVFLDWLRPKGTRPGGQVFIGLAAGLIGMILLVGPGEISGQSSVDRLGAMVLILAALSWSIGSIYSRSALLPPSPLLATAMEMLMGGLLLWAAGLATGEGARLNISGVSLLSLASLAYLVFFGSIIAFSAYIWLLQVTTPARASTYAFVNPVVALFLGWLLAGEPLTFRTLIAAAIIVLAVMLITTARQGQLPQKAEAIS